MHAEKQWRLRSPVVSAVHKARFPRHSISARVPGGGVNSPHFLLSVPFTGALVASYRTVPDCNFHRQLLKSSDTTETSCWGPLALPGLILCGVLPRKFWSICPQFLACQTLEEQVTPIAVASPSLVLRGRSARFCL